jgi:hypothetical protein
VIEARDLSSRPEAVQGIATLRANVAGAEVSAFVTEARLAPLELHATGVLRGVDAALLRLYVPEAAPVGLARGIVNATVQVDHTAADGTRLAGDATLTGLEAQGRGALATLAVTSPSLRVTVAEARRQGEHLSVGRVELSGGGRLTDSRGPSARFDLSELRIATEGLTWPVTAPARVEVGLGFRDGGAVEASGTARLTAPLPAVAWAAELALQARAVDLAPLAAYVPAARGLGGRVRARLTLGLAYAGGLTARVSGDVVGARFALADGERGLLSLRRIEATGLDLQWPDRLGIKQLRLRQPYAFIERDRQGRFPLLARVAPPAPPVGPPGPARSDGPPGRFSAAIEEVVVENGRATLLDEVPGTPMRFDVPRVDLTARNVTWPAAGPTQIEIEAALPGAGALKVEGGVSAEPAGADVRLEVRDAELAWLQPYLGFRARVGGRLDATLAVAGVLAPALRLRISGDAGLSGLGISDGQRSVLTTDSLRVTGIEVLWPERITLGRVQARGSWALIERDAQGRFLLRTLLERQGAGMARPAPSAPSPPAASAGAPLEFRLREGVFEGQAATVVDGITTPPVRLEVAGARLAVRDLTWPSRTQATVELTSPMPAGGRLDVSGTVELEPLRLEARAVLDAVAIAPAQPYLPIEGRVGGKVSGDMTVKVGLEPTTVQVAGQARLQAFRLNDGDRAVIAVGRVDTVGIDVDWPRRIRLERMRLRRPRLLIERDAQGEIRLRRLVTPRWAAPAAGEAPPDASRTIRGASAAPARPTIEIGTLGLERASARFVDHTTRPAYAEELEDVSVTLTPLTTTPGRRMRFTAEGLIGGGTLTLQGEHAPGDREALDLRLALRNFVLPRANPYLAKYTAWRATRGSLDIAGSYGLDGAEVATRHDVVVRGLEVERVDERDEVERRLGLPFGLLVSLLKDARGEIRLSLPVSGNLGTREFDYHEAVWSAVRAVAIRLLALPFSKVGSLFFSEDSKIQAVALGPAVFEPGTDRLGPEMGPHLDRVAVFLRGAPSVKVVLDPILVDADLLALRREQILRRLAAAGGSPAGAGPLERARQEHGRAWPDRPTPATLEAIVAELAAAERLPADAMRTLAAQRLDAVRRGVARGGGVDLTRLAGRARRNPLVEAAGNPRVEFDLRP